MKDAGREDAIEGHWPEVEEAHWALAVDSHAMTLTLLMECGAALLALLPPLLALVLAQVLGTAAVPAVAPAVAELLCGEGAGWALVLLLLPLFLASLLPLAALLPAC